MVRNSYFGTDLRSFSTIERFESCIFVSFYVSLQMQRNAKSTPVFSDCSCRRKQKIGLRRSRSTAPKPYFAWFCPIFAQNAEKNAFCRGRQKTFLLWWRQRDSNSRPFARQANALTSWAMPPNMYWRSEPFNAEWMVDHRGIEPLTSRLRTWRSPSWANGPHCSDSISQQK